MITGAASWTTAESASAISISRRPRYLRQISSTLQARLERAADQLKQDSLELGVRLLDDLRIQSTVGSWSPWRCLLSACSSHLTKGLPCRASQRVTIERDLHTPGEDEKHAVTRVAAAQTGPALRATASLPPGSEPTASWVKPSKVSRSRSWRMLALGWARADNELRAAAVTGSGTALVRVSREPSEPRITILVSAARWMIDGGCDSSIPAIGACRISVGAVLLEVVQRMVELGIRHQGPAHHAAPRQRKAARSAPSRRRRLVETIPPLRSHDAHG